MPTPVAPVAPVTPAPVAPVAPVAPTPPAPVAPVAPVTPAPVAPVAPVGPATPVAPVTPAQVGPVAPVAPAAPVAPSTPIVPATPVAPVTPGDHCGPGVVTFTITSEVDTFTLTVPDSKLVLQLMLCILPKGKESLLDNILHVQMDLSTIRHSNRHLVDLLYQRLLKPSQFFL